MSQFAREHPEDYEERLEAMVDAADMERKRRKEEGAPLAGLPRESRVEGARRLLREAEEAERLHDTEPERWGGPIEQRVRDEERDRD